MIAHHFTHGKRQTESNRQRQTFRNGNDYNGHGVDQVIQDKRRVPAVGFAVDAPANHARQKGENRGAYAKVTDLQHQAFETLLKGRVARFDDQSFKNHPPLRARADADNHRRTRTFGNGRTAQHEWVLVARL